MISQSKGLRILRLSRYCNYHVLKSHRNNSKISNYDRHS